MRLFYLAIVIFIVLNILLITYIKAFNSIQIFKIKIDEAESKIDEYLRLRYDLITKLSLAIVSITKTKKEYFKDIEKVLEENLSSFDFDRRLSSFNNLIVQFKNDYPKLNDNHDFLALNNELEVNFEKLLASKNYYNKWTTEYNKIIMTFPSNFVAKIHKFKVKNYFDSKNLYDERTNDFKI